MSRIPDRVVAEVLARAGSDILCCLVCEACGGAIAGGYALHHRHARGMGGAANDFPWIDAAPNLMVVHGDLARNCHNLTAYSVHQNPARSRRLGHILPFGTNPASVPWTVEPRLMELRA